MTSTPTPRHKVVVIGSGFGGLFGTKALRRADVDVTVIAKTTHHLFQPLLYQVATGILSEGEIAPPTREILAGQDNARVILGEVTVRVKVNGKTFTGRGGSPDIVDGAVRAYLHAINKAANARALEAQQLEKASYLWGV